MKFIKSKLLWFVIILLAAGGAGAFFYFNKATSVEYVTEPVVLGDLNQTVTATGQVKSASEINLNFKNLGKIREINIKVGDQVRKDTVVAKLKATDLEIELSKAQANLLEANANLNKIINGATSQEIEVSKAALEKAKTDLANAKTDLLSTQKTYQQALESFKQALLVDVNSAITKAEITLDLVDDIFNYNGDENNFNTTNAGLESTVIQKRQLSLSLIANLESLYLKTKLSPSDENINLLSQDALAMLDTVEATADGMRSLLQYVILNTSLTQSELDSIKADVDAQRITIDTQIDTIQGSVENVTDAKIDLATKEQAAQGAIEAAEKNVVKAQTDLDLKQAPARQEDIDLYRAGVVRAQADVRAAQDKLEDTVLQSPIDGVVTDVNYEVGEQISATTPVITLLASNGSEVEVDIPESDIAKLSEGYAAEITLDAFSDNEIFIGTVFSINPAQTEIQDVIYYKVTVVFNSEQSEAVASYLEKIKPGMTANVTIKTAEKNNVLIIPSRAIKEINGQSIVQVLENQNVREVSVKTGLRGDEGQVEVLSGLSAGQQVVTFTRQK